MLCDINNDDKNTNIDLDAGFIARDNIGEERQIFGNQTLIITIFISLLIQ